MAFIRPFMGPRPHYESTVPIPWRLRQNDATSPAFGGDIWWKMCGKKRAFFDWDGAVFAALLLAVRFRQRGKVLRAYKCPWCEWWHIGHRAKERGEN